MTDDRQYLIDTSAHRVRVEPTIDGIVLKLKPKRGRAWMEFEMTNETARVIMLLMEYSIKNGPIDD